MKTKKNEVNMKTVCQKATFFLLVAILACGSLKAERTITGQVTDANNQTPLSGATIVLKGTSTGTISDVSGNYLIKVPDRGAILVFTFIGFEPKDVKVGNENSVNVALQPSKQILDEVVVLGYEVMHKADVCGAVSGISRQPMMRREHNKRSTSPVHFNPSVESYTKINANGFKQVNANPLSTLSIDVDRASYTNVRRFIEQGEMPPADATRVEEMINYFEYNYPQPTDEHPFSINTEYTGCPWQNGHKLLRIGLQGKKIATENLPASNLVFLIDVSGSMGDSNKLPLVKSAFKLLANNLRSKDHVAIVVYAGAAGLVLPSTDGNEKNKILDALNSLNAGGSTAGCEGIALAYKVAKENYIEGGNNRVILATDGDFNVGISNENELENFIVEKRKDEIFLTCLGFGMGNYKDSKMEILADKGNGNYAYIDDMVEANKVFINEFGGTLFTIAKDVKIQIEFNPNEVQAYRLIGYENRLLNDEDFKDDTKDAGELGSGHTVTALYEVIPVGVTSKFIPEVDDLKYQKLKSQRVAGTNEVATVKFRYKKPDGNKSIEMVHPINSSTLAFDLSSENTRFAASVAMFGMLLTQSEYLGSTTFELTKTIASSAKGNDNEGYRGEFIRLVKTAGNLSPRAER